MQYSTRARTRSTTENRAKLSIYDLNLIYNRKSQQQQNHLRTAIIKPNRTHPKYAQRTLRLATCVCVPSGMQWNRWKNMHSFCFFNCEEPVRFFETRMSLSLLCCCHCRRRHRIGNMLPWRIAVVIRRVMAAYKFVMWVHVTHDAHSDDRVRAHTHHIDILHYVCGFFFYSI